MASQEMIEAFEDFYGFQWERVQNTAQQAWAKAWNDSRQNLLDGPHDWLAQDLIKQLVDNAQAIQETSEQDEDRFAIVLLAAAERIRRLEAKVQLLREQNADNELRKGRQSHTGKGAAQ